MLWAAASHGDQKAASKIIEFINKEISSEFDTYSCLGQNFVVPLDFIFSCFPDLPVEKAFRLNIFNNSDKWEWGVSDYRCGSHDLVWKSYLGCTSRIGQKLKLIRKGHLSLISSVMENFRIIVDEGLAQEAYPKAGYSIVQALKKLREFLEIILDMEVYDEKLRSEFLLLTNKLLRCFWKYEFFPVSKYGLREDFSALPLMFTVLDLLEMQEESEHFHELILERCEQKLHEEGKNDEEKEKDKSEIARRFMDILLLFAKKQTFVDSCAGSHKGIWQIKKLKFTSDLGRKYQNFIHQLGGTDYCLFQSLQCLTLIQFDEKLEGYVESLHKLYKMAAITKSSTISYHMMWDTAAQFAYRGEEEMACQVLENLYWPKLLGSDWGWNMRKYFTEYFLIYNESKKQFRFHPTWQKIVDDCSKREDDCKYSWLAEISVIRLVLEKQNRSDLYPLAIKSFLPFIEKEAKHDENTQSFFQFWKEFGYVELTPIKVARKLNEKYSESLVDYYFRDKWDKKDIIELIKNLTHQNRLKTIHRYFSYEASKERQHASDFYYYIGELLELLCLWNPKEFNDYLICILENAKKHSKKNKEWNCFLDKLLENDILLSQKAANLLVEILPIQEGTELCKDLIIVLLSKHKLHVSNFPSYIEEPRSHQGQDRWRAFIVNTGKMRKSRDLNQRGMKKYFINPWSYYNGPGTFLKYLKKYCNYDAFTALFKSILQDISHQKFDLSKQKTRHSKCKVINDFINFLRLKSENNRIFLLYVYNLIIRKNFQGFQDSIFGYLSSIAWLERYNPKLTNSLLRRICIGLSAEKVGRQAITDFANRFHEWLDEKPVPLLQNKTQNRPSLDGSFTSHEKKLCRKTIRKRTLQRGLGIDARKLSFT